MYASALRVQAQRSLQDLKDMNSSKGQGELFLNTGTETEILKVQEGIKLSEDVLKNWQQRLQNHQAKLFSSPQTAPKQGSFFTPKKKAPINYLEPMKLTPLPLSFWRWPNSPHKGPALYLVMDRPKHLDTPILLYIGETMHADKRWKGEHDCKEYLAGYNEALTSLGLTSQLSIRFWTDVPTATKARRQIEQQLIQLWLPPFNKETRSRWATPFTTDIN